MTDEATPTGAESAANAAAEAPEAQPQRLSDVDRLKAILGGKSPQPEEPAPEAATAKPEATEESAEEPEAKASDEEAEAPTETTEDDQTPDLARVAKMLGVAPTELVVNEDGTVGFKTKVDGQEGRANLESLRKSFQLENAHTRRLMELSEKQKSFESERAAFEQAQQASKAKLDEYLAIARAELIGEIESSDLETLRQTDPISYLQRKDELTLRVERLNRALQDRETERAKSVEAQRAEMAKRIEAEFRELLNHVPSWADETVRKNDMAELVGFLKNNYGASDADINAVAQTSAMAIRIIRDAHRWHKSQADTKKAKAEVLKKVEAAPKMAKPGTPNTAVNQKRELEKARVAFRKSGGRNDVGAQVLKQLGVVGRKR